MKFGLEVEKTFANTATGEPTLVNETYFRSLGAAKLARGTASGKPGNDVTPTSIESAWSVEQLDGCLHLGEASMKPVDETDGGLRELARRALIELDDCQKALQPLGGTVINMSNNPLVVKTPANLDRLSIKRPGSYAREVRRWNPEATIDGSCQNSPSTSIRSFQAADAMNVLIGLGGAFIALYGNSPFAEGRQTGEKESRLRMWEQYFRHSAVASDKLLYTAPNGPFSSLKDYFEWIFKSPKKIFCVEEQVHEGEKSTIIVDDLSVLEYIAQPSCFGVAYPSKEKIQLVPKLKHLERNQFMQFFGARLRFGFHDGEVGTDGFRTAIQMGEGGLETFMDENCAFMYVEGRDPGATFSDAHLEVIAPDTLQSVLISPSAIQAGLINQLDAAKKIVVKYGWQTLMGLREEAIKYGMGGSYAGKNMRDLVAEVIDVSADGLAAEDTWMLRYPQHVLETGKNSADRQLALYERTKGNSPFEKLRSLVVASQITSPDRLLQHLD